MHTKGLGGVLCLVLLTACAQVPKPSTYPFSFQQHMQAAHHWKVLARQVVGELVAVTAREQDYSGSRTTSILSPQSVQIRGP